MPDSTPATARFRGRCPGCGHSCCPYPSLDCGGESDAVRNCRHCAVQPIPGGDTMSHDDHTLRPEPEPTASAPYGFGLLRRSDPSADLTPITGGLDETVEMVNMDDTDDTPTATGSETEYAECPECENDGPHIVMDDQLECGNCYSMFDNPFAD